MKPILVIGPARSGTTFLSRSLGRVLNVPVLVEPHLLWKYGELSFFNDDEFLISNTSSKYIRDVFRQHVGNDIFIEKSPINCVRALKVFSVFPDAIIIYVKREPSRIIASNIVRSKNGDQFSLSIFFEKFVKRRGEGILAYNNEIYINLKSQLGNNYLDFILYSVKGLYFKITKRLPFGPKIQNFYDVSNEKQDYYTRVLDKANENEKLYCQLYSGKFYSFNVDDFENEFVNLIKWLNVSYDPEKLKSILKKSDTKGRK